MDIDSMWAELQAEDSAARQKKKKVTGKKKTQPKLSTNKPKEAPVAQAPVKDFTDEFTDKEITSENVSQHLHFHIRSIMGGNLGQRKQSLRAIGGCAAHH